MNKRLGSVLIFCLFTMNVIAQGQANNWYFGENAGITFNNDGSVTALTDGQINTYEGCASISNEDGQLLFYTDGITVYGNDHAILANGTGLYGDPSSTQSALIVPKPEDPNIFYIFTVDTSVSSDDSDLGLNYSTVDMSLNGGLGRVISKNTPLLADCSEKITAVLKNCFDKSIWVLTLASENGDAPLFNTFHAFEVNTSGVVTASVKSPVGQIINDGRGTLKLSSDGKKMACANTGNGLLLSDFDADTGIVSNTINLSINDSNIQPYGIEFSSSNQFLYVSTFSNGNEESSSLLQYDITSNNISASQVLLDKRNTYRGGLQMGPNGKIYKTIANSYQEGTPYLGVIYNPDNRGTASNYQHNAVNLLGRNATQGLPPFIQSFFSKTNIIVNDDGSTTNTVSLCENEPLLLKIEAVPGATYEWKKDGLPIPNNTNEISFTSLMPLDAGIYEVIVTDADISKCPIIGEATIMVRALPETSVITVVQCDIDVIDSTDGFTGINLINAVKDIPDADNLSFEFFESAADMTNGNAITTPTSFINTVATNQTILYTATKNDGCSSSSEISINIQPTTLSLSPQSPFYSCDIDSSDGVLEGFFDLEAIRLQNYPNLEATFYTSINDVTLEQNAVSQDLITENITLYVRIENANQCQGVEEIELVVNPAPVFNLDETYILCTDNPDTNIQAPAGYDFYNWYKITASNKIEVSTTASFRPTEIGNYECEVGYNYTQNGATTSCPTTVSFEVLPSNIASITTIDVIDVSENNQITIAVSGDGDYEYSLDNINYQDNPFFDDVAAGFITVYVQDKNGCGTADQLVSIVGFDKFFTPNGDGNNDFWRVKGVNAQFQSETLVYIYDRYGKLLTQITANSSGWDGNFNGQEAPSNDYWFTILLEDGRTIKGHFTLKR